MSSTPTSSTRNGPLREMANRIGATTAVLRRSIDRLWENQSIETCDDWVIPYIAELVGTRLVQGLDTSGQRLDVANTIAYRRRKGTVGLLEQLAHDISGWDAKVVEFFRRLGRTRHGLDPPIGPIGTPGSQLTALHEAEGLVGPLTCTHIGGFADLRNVYGAGKSRSAFDEFYHFADTRQGDGLFGWHAIPHLGVFVWRLLSLGVGPVTPVAVIGLPGWFTFDPTGPRHRRCSRAQRDVDRVRRHLGLAEQRASCRRRSRRRCSTPTSPQARAGSASTRSCRRQQNVADARAGDERRPRGDLE